MERKLKNTGSLLEQSKSALMTCYVTRDCLVIRLKGKIRPIEDSTANGLVPFIFQSSKCCLFRLLGF